MAFLGPSGISGAVRIDIHVPGKFLALLAAGGLIFLWGRSTGTAPQTADVVGGSVQDLETVAAEEDVDHLREERLVLERRTEILQEQAAILDAEIENQRGVATESQVRELERARREIVALMADQTRAEREIKETLRTIWEAQGVASAASLRKHGKTPTFTWPIEPERGLSAGFDDAEYEEVIGLKHYGVDVRAGPETAVHSAADGEVTRVADNGLGYSYVVIEHEGGFATVYGHIPFFYVEEGDIVRRGQVIALSGGAPGTKGTGRIYTGPHLHFELHKDGTAIDPLEYMPGYPGIPGVGQAD